MNPNAINYLSLARKAGRIEVGEEPAGAAARAGHARLVLVAADAPDSTRRRAKSFVAGTDQQMLILPFTKEEMGTALGRTVVALAAMTDPAMALAFVKALGEPEQHAQVLKNLEEKAQRLRRHQLEQKAHEKNLRTGKVRKEKKEAAPEVQVPQTAQAARQGYATRKAHEEEGQRQTRNGAGASRSYGEKKPHGERKSFEGSKSFGEKKPYGERKSFDGSKSFGEKKPYGERKSFDGSKSFGEKKPYGERKAVRFSGEKPAQGEKKPYVFREGGKPFGTSGSKFSPKGNQNRNHTGKVAGQRVVTGNKTAGRKSGK